MFTVQPLVSGRDYLALRADDTLLGIVCTYLQVGDVPGDIRRADTYLIDGDEEATFETVKDAKQYMRNLGAVRFQLD